MQDGNALTGSLLSAISRSTDSYNLCPVKMTNPASFRKQKCATEPQMTEKVEDPYDTPDSEFPAKAEEGCYVDENGVLSDDAFHAEFLDNPEAEHAFQVMIFDKAISEGMEPALAMELYGNVRPTHNQTDVGNETNGAVVTEDYDGKQGPRLSLAAAHELDSLSRWEILAREPGIGMDNDGNLNIVGFDEDYAPGGSKDPAKKKK